MLNVYDVHVCSLVHFAVVRRFLNLFIDVLKFPFELLEPTYLFYSEAPDPKVSLLIFFLEHGSIELSSESEVDDRLSFLN